VSESQGGYKDTKRKDNKANFSFYRGSNRFYTVTVNGTRWMFPVSLEDTSLTTGSHKIVSCTHRLLNPSGDKRGVVLPIVVPSDTYTKKGNGVFRSP
jgi:hypothetical protein